MVRKQEFLTRLLYLIGDKLGKNLPDEATLEEMIDKAKELIKEIYG